MNLKVKTTKLQEMLNKALKGAGNNKLLPITSLISISVKDNVLTLTTTDATNYLYIKDEIKADDFSVVIHIETFAKLVAKMTCEDVELNVTDKGLEVVGNGTYVIPIPIDEEGNGIKYPNPREGFTAENMSKLTLSTVKTILHSIKPSLSTSNDVPVYTGYYVGDTVVSTDGYKIAGFKVNVFDDAKLISSEMMDLLDVMTDEVIVVATNGNKLVFETENCVVYGTIMDGVDDFPISPITDFLYKDAFPSMCKISKTHILQVLDRIGLFVGEFDDGVVNIKFTDNHLEITSVSSSGTEIIQYAESEDAKDFNATINLNMLVTQIKAQASDTVTIYYGKDNSIRLVDGDITLIVALTE